MRATQPGQSFLLLLDVVDVEIPYAIVGAVAASVHGVVRASLDADALLSVTLPSLRQLEERLKKEGFRTELRQGAPDNPISAVLSVTDGHENRVDLLTGIRGFDPAAFSRAIDVPFGADRLHVIGPEDFIAMKIFSGGPQDLSDARQAIAVSGEKLDRPLLERLTKRYGKKYLKLLNSFRDTHP